MHKIVLLCCAGLASPLLFGMQMDQHKQIIPITSSNQTLAASAGQQDISQSKHASCTKGCVCLACSLPAIVADILCVIPLCCRLSPIQKPNESDSEWMKRADENIEPNALHRAAMKERYGNDACSSLKRKMNALLIEKAPHHTQRCEAEWEHLCCFSNALIKFVRE
jgi:hypothetical protein